MVSSKDFERLFEVATTAAREPAPSEDGPWDRIRDAHASAQPVVALVCHPVNDGWAVEVEGLRATLLREGAPPEWSERGPPSPVAVWVLSFSQDREELELVGFGRG